MRLTGQAAGPLEASVFVEGLRAKPAWFAALALATHAVIWTAAMQLAESVPHPEAAVALALGREWMPGYAGAPPLPFWIAESVHRATGSLFGLRLLAAVCVALAGWFVFLLARRIVGDRHAAIATLILVGVYPVAFPVGPFNGDTLQMPLAAAAVWLWWLAAGERKPNAWIILGLVLGAMFYVGPQPIVLFAVFAAITAVAPRARAALFRFDALSCLIFGLFVLAFVITPRMLWLAKNGFANLIAGPGAGIDPRALSSPAELPFTLLFGQAGMAVLVVLATVYAVRARENAPSFIRPPESLLAKRGVFALALLPTAIGVAALLALQIPVKVTAFSSLVLLTGLFAVLMTGEKILIRRQRIVAITALGLLLLPPVLEVALSFAPSYARDASRMTNWPAYNAARTLTDIYRTRTNRPLEFVIGERRRASLLAIASRDRPRIVIDGDLAQSPWVGEAELKAKGGIVFWEIRGADTSPPKELSDRLPPLTLEAPLRLPWARGGADPVRLGWAILPPGQ